MRKYEFTGDERVIDNVIILKRIRRCTDGLLGGWIESEDNLSQEGGCFVYNESCVLDFARVEEDAQVLGESVICDLAVIKGNVRIIHGIVGGTAILAASSGDLVGVEIDTDDDIERRHYEDRNKISVAA